MRFRQSTAADVERPRYSNKMTAGHVKFFNQAKGFGFVVPDGAKPGGSGIFVHARSVRTGVAGLYAGRKVEFVTKQNSRGEYADEVREGEAPQMKHGRVIKMTKEYGFIQTSDEIYNGDNLFFHISAVRAVVAEADSVDYVGGRSAASGPNSDRPCAVLVRAAAQQKLGTKQEGGSEAKSQQWGVENATNLANAGGVASAEGARSAGMVGLATSMHQQKTLAEEQSAKIEALTRKINAMQAVINAIRGEAKEVKKELSAMETKEDDRWSYIDLVIEQLAEPGTMRMAGLAELN